MCTKEGLSGGVFSAMHRKYLVCARQACSSNSTVEVTKNVIVKAN